MSVSWAAVSQVALTVPTSDKTFGHIWIRSILHDMCMSVSGGAATSAVTDAMAARHGRHFMTTLDNAYTSASELASCHSACTPEASHQHGAPRLA